MSISRTRILRVSLALAISLTVTAGSAQAQPEPRQVTTPNVVNVPGSTQVTVGAQVFVNQGLAEVLTLSGHEAR